MRLSPVELQEAFDLLRVPDLAPRYNIAPTQSVAVVRRTEAGNDLSMMRWGLIPSWAKDTKIGARLINARSDTVATKPAFRSAFKRRRCLIPADGYYEWKRTGPKSKQPYLIGLNHDQPMAFAGLWEIWKSPEGGATIESCTILTTEANQFLSEIHDRMPVILHARDREVWLDPDVPPDALSVILHPYVEEAMQAHPVSTLVNKASNEVPECVRPTDAANGTLFPD